MLPSLSVKMWNINRMKQKNVKIRGTLTSTQ